MINLLLFREAFCFSSHFLVSNTAHSNCSMRHAPWLRKNSVHSSAVVISHRETDFKILLYITVYKSVFTTIRFPCIRTTYLQVYREDSRGMKFHPGRRKHELFQHLFVISDTTYYTDDISTLSNTSISQK